MRVLFIPFAPSLAHVSRCLAMAEVLRAEGSDVVFGIGKERMGMIQNAGFDVEQLPEVESDTFRMDRGFGWLTKEYFVQGLEAERGIISDVSPDFVVFDFRFTTTTAAHLSGLKTVSILHGNALRLVQQPMETAQLLIGGKNALRGFDMARLAIMRKLFPVIFQRILGRVAARLNPVLKDHGMSLVKSPFELLKGDATFLADIPAMLPKELPLNSHIVGPLMWSGWSQKAPWLDEMDSRSLIYVTMGSTVEASSTIIKIIDALYDVPYNVVISAGDLRLPNGYKIPSHIRVMSTVPGDAVAKQSSIVIHHGGHGTLMQALASGVPSLVIPSNPDQVLIAQQVQSLNIGYTMWRPGDLPMSEGAFHRMTPGQIRVEIDKLINDSSCRLACQKYRQEIEGYKNVLKNVPSLLKDMVI